MSGLMDIYDALMTKQRFPLPYQFGTALRLRLLDYFNVLDPNQFDNFQHH